MWVHMYIRRALRYVVCSSSFLSHVTSCYLTVYTWSISLLWLLWLLWLLCLLWRCSSSVAHPCPALMSSTRHVDVYLLLLPLPLQLPAPASVSRFRFHCRSRFCSHSRTHPSILETSHPEREARRLPWSDTTGNLMTLIP